MAVMYCLSWTGERNFKVLGPGLALPAVTTTAEADSSAA